MVAVSMRLTGADAVALRTSLLPPRAVTGPAKAHDGTMTIMVAGESDKLAAFSDLAKPFGIVELQRTGRITLARVARQPVRLRSVKTARA